MNRPPVTRGKFIETLTIAIPFYSNLVFLQKAVESVLRQTDSDFLALISDDCGPDGEQAEVYVRSLGDPRFRYIRLEKNLGLAGNWNNCLQLATTDLITLLHADDVLAPNYVKKMKDAAALQPQASMLFCQAEIIDDKDNRIFSFPDFIKKLIAPKPSGTSMVAGDEGLAGLLKGCYIMCPTLCYRRKKLEGLNFSSTWKMVIDLDFYARVLFGGGLIVGISDCLYRYRRHDSNQTKILTESVVRFQEEAKIYNDIADRADLLGWTESARMGRRKTIIKLNILYCVMIDFLKLQFSAAKCKLRFLQGIL